ncbi:MAG: hypothetical protein HY820_19610 [Acidobacteria bacterium]|nr:hypothetical protein [Acidobacteriota bacterium]
MPFAFWSEIINPADIFPARYHRKEDAPPYPPPPPPLPPPSPALKRHIDAAAREIHALHFKVWETFALKLRQLLEPLPDLFNAVRPLIYDANCTFLKPLQEIGWKLPST